MLRQAALLAYMRIRVADNIADVCTVTTVDMHRLLKQQLLMLPTLRGT
jgi:hypothetical protein